MSTLTSRRALAAMIAAALPLAACGSSGSNSSGDPSASTKATKGLQFSSCMRTHGVPNFPDLGTNGNGALRIVQNNGNTQVNGVNVNGPAFKSAMQACRSKLPNGGRPQPISASRRNAMLAFSRCMRSHGVSGFPDPTFSGGGAGLMINKGSGIDPNAPTFKSAQQACSSILKGAGLKTGL